MAGKRALSDEDVLALRAAYYEDGLTQKQLAEQYGIALTTCRRAIHGIASRRRVPSGERLSAKLNVKSVSDIRRKLANGMVGADLAREYGVSEPVISLIKHNHIWKDIQ